MKVIFEKAAGKLKLKQTRSATTLEIQLEGIAPRKHVCDAGA